MNEDILKDIYDSVGSEYDLGTFDNFKQNLSDPSARKDFYDSVSSDFELGSFDNFNTQIDGTTTSNEQPENPNDGTLQPRPSSDETPVSIKPRKESKVARGGIFAALGFDSVASAEEKAAKVTEEELLNISSVNFVNTDGLGEDATEDDRNILKDEFLQTRGSYNQIQDANKTVLDRKYGDNWKKNYSNNIKLQNNLVNQYNDIIGQANKSKNQVQQDQLIKRSESILKRAEEAKAANEALEQDNNFKSFIDASTNLSNLEKNRFKIFPEAKRQEEVVKSVQANTDKEFSEAEGFIDNTTQYGKRRLTKIADLYGKLEQTVEAGIATAADAVGAEETGRKFRRKVEETQFERNVVAANEPTRFKGDVRELTADFDGGTVVFDRETNKPSYKRDKDGNIVKLTEDEVESIEESKLVDKSELRFDARRGLSQFEGSVVDMAFAVAVTKSPVGVLGTRATLAGSSTITIFGDEYARQVEKGNPDAGKTAASIAAANGLIEAYVGDLESGLVGKFGKSADEVAEISTKARDEVIEKLVKNEITVEGVLPAMAKATGAAIKPFAGEFAEEVLQNTTEGIANNVANNESIEYKASELENIAFSVGLMTLLPGAASAKKSWNDRFGQAELSDALVYATANEGNFNKFNETVDDFLASGEITEEQAEEKKKQVQYVKEEVDIYRENVSDDDIAIVAPLIAERGFLENQNQTIINPRVAVKRQEKIDDLNDRIDNVVETGTRLRAEAAINTLRNPVEETEVTQQEARATDLVDRQRELQTELDDDSITEERRIEVEEELKGVTEEFNILSGQAEETTTELTPTLQANNDIEVTPESRKARQEVFQESDLKSGLEVQVGNRKAVIKEVQDKHVVLNFEGGKEQRKVKKTLVANLNDPKSKTVAKNPTDAVLPIQGDVINVPQEDDSTISYTFDGGDWINTETSEKVSDPNIKSEVQSIFEEIYSEDNVNRNTPRESDDTPSEGVSINNEINDVTQDVPTSQDTNTNNNETTEGEENQETDSRGVGDTNDTQGNQADIEGQTSEQKLTRKVEPSALPNAKQANEITWFHGSGDEISKPNTSGTELSGLLGRGFYLTDDPKIAESYAKARQKRTKKKFLHKVKVKLGKVLNMENKLPQKVVDLFKSRSNDLYDLSEDIDKIQEESVSGMDFYTKLRSLVNEIAQEDGDSEIIFQYLEGFDEDLKSIGYDAMTHVGGLRASKSGIQHKVIVLLDVGDLKVVNEKVSAQNTEIIDNIEAINLDSNELQTTEVEPTGTQDTQSQEDGQNQSGNSTVTNTTESPSNSSTDDKLNDEVSKVDRILDTERKVNSTLKATIKFVRPLMKSLGIKINTYSDSDSFGTALKSKGITNPEIYDGYYDPTDKTIYIDLRSENTSVAFHEAIHPVVAELIRTKPNVFKQFVEEMIQDKELSNYANFGEQYNNLSLEERQEESLVEAIAKTVFDQVLKRAESDKGVLSKVKKLINSLLSRLGFNNTSVNKLTGRDADLLDFIDNITDAIYNKKGFLESKDVANNPDSRGRAALKSKSATLGSIRRLARQGKFQGVSPQSIVDSTKKRGITLTLDEVINALEIKTSESIFGESTGKVFLDARKDMVDSVLDQINGSERVPGYSKTTLQEITQEAYDNGYINDTGTIDPIKDIVDQVTLGESIGAAKQLALGWWTGKLQENLERIDEELTKRVKEGRDVSDLRTLRQENILNQSSIANALSTARSRSGRDLGFVARLARGQEFSEASLISLFNKSKRNDKAITKKQSSKLSSIARKIKKLENQLDKDRNILDKTTKERIEKSVDTYLNKQKKSRRTTQIRNTLIKELEARALKKLEDLKKKITQAEKEKNKGKAAISRLGMVNLTASSSQLHSYKRVADLLIEENVANDIDGLLKVMNGNGIPISRDTLITALLMGDPAQQKAQLTLIKRRRKEVEYLNTRIDSAQKKIDSFDADNYTQKNQRELLEDLDSILTYALSQVDKTISKDVFSNVIDKKVQEVKDTLAEYLEGNSTKADVVSSFNRLKNLPSFTKDTISSLERARKAILNGDFSSIRDLLPLVSESRLNTRIGSLTAQINDDKRAAYDYIESETNKGLTRAKKILDIPRSMLLMLDNSALLIQGGVALGSLLLNPKLFMRSLSNMAEGFRAGFTDLNRSRSVANEIHNELMNDPMSLIREMAGLRISEPDGGFTKGEAIFTSSLTEKLPIIGNVQRASNSAMVTYLNLIRATLFDHYYKNVKNNGKDVTMQELEMVADHINTVTGGVRKKWLDSRIHVISMGVLAPRLYASMFKTSWDIVADPTRLVGGLVKRVKTEEQKSKNRALAFRSTSHAKNLMFWGGIAALAHLIGGEEDDTEFFFDPRNRSSLSIRSGDKRVDLSPLAQYLRIIMSVGVRVGEKFNILEEDKRISTQARYSFYDSVWDEVFQFAKGKANPAVSFAFKIMDRADAIGRPLGIKTNGVPRYVAGKKLEGQTLANTFGDLLTGTTPIFLQNIVEKLTGSDGDIVDEVKNKLEAQDVLMIPLIFSGLQYTNYESPLKYRKVEKFLDDLNYKPTTFQDSGKKSIIPKYLREDPVLKYEFKDAILSRWGKWLKSEIDSGSLPTDFEGLSEGKVKTIRTKMNTSMKRINKEVWKEVQNRYKLPKPPKK